MNHLRHIRIRDSDNVLDRAGYLTGPTASGKTAVGVALAQRLGAEVIALDSMTLYRGMDIGTAKPTHEERGGVPHHLIDVLDPWESASVALYRQWAMEVASEIESRGHRVLFVGGTALYLKALLRGLFEAPTIDVSIRAGLEAEAASIGSTELHKRLASVDRATAARVHPNDLRRLVRALEIYVGTGRPISHWQTEHERPAVGVCVLALDRPRANLHDRIDRRVDVIFGAGFVEEVRRLTSGPIPLHRVPAQAVGYQEVIEHLAGRLTQAEAVERIKARTRQFAKRQMTWMRGLEEVKTLPVVPDEAPDETARRVEAAWQG